MRMGPFRTPTFTLMEGSFPMNRTNRRMFLSDVGRGMLAAGLGTTLANELGFPTAFATEGTDAIPLGEYASLVELMQSTPAEKLQPMLAQMVLEGKVGLKKLIGAGALANANTFGGCDYVGFHTAMALLPALGMSRMLLDRRQPLPVLKVLYRNSQQIQSAGSSSKAALEAIHAAEHSSEGDVATQIRDACHHKSHHRDKKLRDSDESSHHDEDKALKTDNHEEHNAHHNSD